MENKIAAGLLESGFDSGTTVEIYPEEMIALASELCGNVVKILARWYIGQGVQVPESVLDKTLFERMKQRQIKRARLHGIRSKAGEKGGRKRSENAASLQATGQAKRQANSQANRQASMDFASDLLDKATENRDPRNGGNKLKIAENTRNQANRQANDQANDQGINIKTKNIYSNKIYNAGSPDFEDENSSIEIQAKFEEFWNAYPSACPRKTDKKECCKKFKIIFKKAKDQDALFKAIMDGLEKWKLSELWADGDGKYIRAPLVWLNGECWNDSPKANGMPGAPQTQLNNPSLPVGMYVEGNADDYETRF